MPQESQQPPNAISIILVTPESTVSPDFQIFLNQLRWTQQLDQIIINKYYIVLNSQCNFQPQMAQLGWLVQAHTQIVWLTAILPPSIEDKLYQQMKHNQAIVTIYQAQTSWLNVVYQVQQPWIPRVSQGLYQWIKSKAIIAFIQDYIQQAARGKVIIYVNIISQVIAMAWVLRCKAYYSKQLDKAGVLAWFIGASPVITTISILGIGVDILNICSIIHIRTPQMLLDYTQKSSQARQDGQYSKAIIIQPAGWDALVPWIEGVAPKDQEQVAEYIGVVEGVRCCWVVLDQYLDRVVDRYQQWYCQDADAGEQACNGCDPNLEGQEMDPPRVSCSPVLCVAGSMVAREGAREAACESGSMVAREAAREAPFQAGSMAGREAAREVPCQAGSMVVKQAVRQNRRQNSRREAPQIRYRQGDPI